MSRSHERRKTTFQFRLSTLLVAVAVIAFLLGAMRTDCLGLVDLRSPGFVDNDPLLSPTRVSRLDGDTLVLADRREIQMAGDVATA